MQSIDINLPSHVVKTIIKVYTLDTNLQNIFARAIMNILLFGNGTHCCYGDH